MASDNTFTGLPVEMRLSIYSHLLVSQEPISFVEEPYAISPTLRRAWTRGLYPSILRVNKQIFFEANPLLYTDNRFRFMDLWLWPYSGVARIDVTPFLSGISLQADSLRYICINFPSFKQSYFEPHYTVKMDDADINNLRTIQAACTGLLTIEFVLCFAANVPCIADQDNTVDPLTVVDSFLKGIPSLKHIIVNAYSSNHAVISGDDGNEDGNSSIWERMIDHGWTVNVSKTPQRIWISSYDLVDFHIESDYNEYHRELARRESRRRAQLKTAPWKTE